MASAKMLDRSKSLPARFENLLRFFQTEIKMLEFVFFLLLTSLPVRPFIWAIHRFRYMLCLFPVRRTALGPFPYRSWPEKLCILCLDAWKGWKLI